MARITAALLCDFAQVREGLLFVQSAGLTRMYRSEMPAPLKVMVATMVELELHELDSVHEVVVAVKSADAAIEVARHVTGFQNLTSAHAEPGESLLVPVVSDFTPFGVDAYGAYDVWVGVDGATGIQLTFYVKPLPQPAP